MRIFYGVQGTGNGHITRARAMASELLKLGAKVDYLFSGRDIDQYFDMDIFGDFRTVAGLTFSFNQGRISPIKTALNLKPIQFLQDVCALDLAPYDLVITDFEPVTAWAAKRQKKAAIGLGHQYSFHHAIPQHRGSPLQKAILRHFAPASKSIGLHWHHFGQPIFPPIAPIEGTPSPRANYYVVYLPFEDPSEIVKLLAPFTDYRFSIYHPQAPSASPDHLQWNLPSWMPFREDLLRCQGVICNAGFELASEVLQLGGKLLVKPIHGQSEQISNALALNTLGYGQVMTRLDTEAVESWLQSTSTIQIHYPGVAAALSQWLVSGATDSLSDLSKSLWARAQLPESDYDDTPVAAVSCKAISKIG